MAATVETKYFLNLGLLKKAPEVSITGFGICTGISRFVLGDPLPSGLSCEVMGW